MTVPVLLVAGFLGAGKTTFINQVLHQPHGQRIAAIVNDFGQINIDAALLENAADDVIGLRNGCICCAMQGDLLRTLRQVLDGQAPDLIVIEASGVADPGGIVNALLDPVLRQAVSLDCVLSLVDAEDVTANPMRRRDPLWQAQVKAADMVRLSRADAVDPASIDALRGHLAELGARHVLGDDDTTLAAVVGMAGRARFPLPAAQIQTSDRFATCEWQSDGPIGMHGFRAAMNRISPHVLRAKGFVNFAEKPGQPFLFQLAGKRATMTPQPSAAPGCKLVLIGEADRMRDVDIAALLDATRPN